MTLPAARHMVRLDPQDGRAATWLLAVQQDGANGHWLSMYRSVDETSTWSWYAPVQDACCERDTPDLIAVVASAPSPISIRIVRPSSRLQPPATPLACPDSSR